MYEKKIREALEINKLKTINEEDKTFTVLKNILNLNFSWNSRFEIRPFALLALQVENRLQNLQMHTEY